MVRRSRAGTASPIHLPAGLVLLALVSPGRAELAVFPPEEVAERWTVHRGEATWLAVDGREWELVTDPNDPAISPLGDGAFHPMDPTEVRRALEDLGAIPQELSGKVLVLPLPRRTSLKSSCEGGIIFLSPGIREVRPEHVHATVVHEVGHLVQRHRAPESSVEWEEYRTMRGLDPDRFHDAAPHSDRPREIFAEDFRVLRGGPLAVASGSHENPTLPPAWQVGGLAEWFDELVREPSLRAPGRRERPQSYPNPAGKGGGELEVRFTSTSAATLSATAEVFDVSGRRVRTLAGVWRDAETVTFRWNGRDARGREVGSGIYLVRWRERPDAGTARVQLLR